MMIASFNDFGWEGPYQGQMKAAILQANPNATIIDAMIDVPAFDVSSASLLLAGIDDYFPNNCIFLCVVDPGVGSARRPIYIQADDRFYVGPDNGLFTQVIRNANNVEAYEIIADHHSLSKSFHGRDLFGPVAAQLSLGEKVKSRSIEVSALISLENQTVKHQIIYIDHYGNCWTGLRATDFSTDKTFTVNGKSLNYRSTFSDAEIGESFWYFNSSGFIEFAVNQGSASKELDLKIGITF